MLIHFSDWPTPSSMGPHVIPLSHLLPHPHVSVRTSPPALGLVASRQHFTKIPCQSMDSAADRGKGEELGSPMIGHHQTWLSGGVLEDRGVCGG